MPESVWHGPHLWSPSSARRVRQAGLRGCTGYARASTGRHTRIGKDAALVGVNISIRRLSIRNVSSFISYAWLHCKHLMVGHGDVAGLAVTMLPRGINRGPRGSFIAQGLRQ